MKDLKTNDFSIYTYLPKRKESDLSSEAFVFNFFNFI